VTRYVITGEARLDNREELFRALDLPSPDRRVLDDLSLALAAYERWGPACAERLIGDFAFVVSDDRSRIAFGARDALGAKPVPLPLLGARARLRRPGLGPSRDRRSPACGR
jgi:asparagine synthase (glutamine-hydrolysing)